MTTPTPVLPASRFAPREVNAWKRAVLKVGSSLLVNREGDLGTRHIAALAGFIRSCRAQGREVLLVSSGAVAAGRMLDAGLRGERNAMAARQALAALGQTRMMALWQEHFPEPLAQVLLTHDDLRNRRRWLNARATLLELLRHRILPVINENDTVAVDELKLGDNDNLAALVAGLVDADVLVIASDVPGLYDANPELHPEARPIAEVARLDAGILALAGESRSGLGTGGMRTKLEAAEKAASTGIDTLLIDGRDAEVLEDLARDRLRGTRIHSGRSRLQARKYWLRHAPATDGVIRVDSGAARALAGGHASLLASGILAVQGGFRRGDMVQIEAEAGGPIARGIAHYGAADLARIRGRHSGEFAGILGYSYGDAVVHRDDLVILAAAPATAGDQGND